VVGEEPKLMVKLIEKRLGQIPETERIKKLLLVLYSTSVLACGSW
jgi:hypothetical protein